MVNFISLFIIILTSVCIGVSVGILIEHKQKEKWKYKDFASHLLNLNFRHYKGVLDSAYNLFKNSNDLSELTENYKKIIMYLDEILKEIGKKYEVKTNKDGEPLPELWHGVVLDKKTEKVISIERSSHFAFCKDIPPFFIDKDGNKTNFDEEKHSWYIFKSRIFYDNAMIEKIFAKITEEGHPISNLEYLYKIEFDKKF